MAKGDWWPVPASEAAMQRSALSAPTPSRFYRPYGTGKRRGRGWTVSVIGARQNVLERGYYVACIYYFGSIHLSFFELPNMIWKGVEPGVILILWLVSLMYHDLGYFDFKTRALERLDSPFGPRLLPM